MDKIEDIWKKGHKKGLEHKEQLSDDQIKDAIKSRSQSYYKNFSHLTRMTLILSFLSFVSILLNIIWYNSNRPIMAVIIISSIISIGILIYCTLKIFDLKDKGIYPQDLRSFLMRLIDFYSKKLRLIYHGAALSIIQTTFSINLYIERTDGIIEGQKLAILSLFYIIFYLGTIFLLNSNSRFHLLDLKNSLRNLEEKTRISLEEEEKRHKSLQRKTFVAISILILTGIVLFFLRFISQ